MRIHVVVCLLSCSLVSCGVEATQEDLGAESVESLALSRPCGAFSVTGGIEAKYNALGGKQSFLKCPITDETATPQRFGRYNHFEGGSIYWSPATGAWSIHGLIRDTWARQGWERGALGFPTSDESASGGYWRHFFEGGSIRCRQSDSTCEVILNGSGPEVVIATAGDIAGSGLAQETTAKLLDGLSFDAVLPLGDLTYPEGTADQISKYFAPTWGRHKAKIRPAPGNHDHASFDSGYCAYFGGAAHCKNGYGYYSYDLGAWHLISLDSGCSSPSSCAASMAAGTPMRQWLTQDLAANNKKCTLVYFHHPRFSSGRHGNDTRSADVWNELYAAGVDVILNGHDHHYERFAPQKPDGAADPQRGIVQFVVGTGGGAFYDTTPKPNSLVRNSDTHGVLLMNLRSEGYSWKFVPEPGKAFTDVGSAPCH